MGPKGKRDWDWDCCVGTGGLGRENRKHGSRVLFAVLMKSEVSSPRISSVFLLGINGLTFVDWRNFPVERSEYFFGRGNFRESEI